MAPRGRSLMSRHVWNTDARLLLAEQERRMAACPDAARYADAEAQAFLAGAYYLDVVDRKVLIKHLQHARIAYPPELAVDQYRLGRHLLQRWQEPGLPERLLRRQFASEVQSLARMKRRRNIQSLVKWVDQQGAPIVFAVMRHNDMADLIGEVTAALSPEQVELGRALTLYGKLLLHHYLTEAGHAGQPSVWEQRKLARRLRLREVQLHAMRSSIYRLRRERRVLLTQLRELGRLDQSETTALLAELDALRQLQAEADQRHAEELDRQARRYGDLVAQARAELVRVQRDCAAALALRSTWLPVVGGNEHVRRGPVALGTSGRRPGGAMGVREGAAGC